MATKNAHQKVKKGIKECHFKSQHAFTEGRQIMDAALTANEALDSVIRNQGKGVIYKVDVEKAYYHVK